MKKLILLAVLFMSYNVIHAADVSPEDQKHLEAYGWIMGKQIMDGTSTEFGFTPAERVYFSKGFMKGAQGEGNSPIVNKEDGEKLQAYLMAKASKQQKHMEAEVAEQVKSSKEAAKAFFEKLEKEGKVKKTASGLYYIVTKEGSKEMPKENSTVKIDYVGTLVDGVEFDSSKKRGEPAVFNLEQVIPGFKEGLQLVGKGGSIKLYMPAELAYGDNVLPGIPAGSALIFDVDMVDILPPAKETK